MLIRVRVNGQWREADCWPGASLLGYLRDGLQLRGTKNACEQGECGSCSVWLNGQVVCACLVLAAQADGGEVTTIEALGDDDARPAWSSGPSSRPGACSAGSARRG